MASFGIIHWLIVAAIVFLVVKPFLPSDRRTMICPSCGSRGPAKIQVRGSIWIEIILWLMLIVPGLIYSIWRLTTKRPVCVQCDQPGIIPIATPRGAELAAKFSPS